MITGPSIARCSLLPLLSFPRPNEQRQLLQNGLYIVSFEGTYAHHNSPVICLLSSFIDISSSYRFNKKVCSYLHMEFHIFTVGCSFRGILQGVSQMPRFGNAVCFSSLRPLRVVGPGLAVSASPQADIGISVVLCSRAVMLLLFLLAQWANGGIGTIICEVQRFVRYKLCCLDHNQVIS